MPPINDISCYFGSKIGLYFGWMQHYISSLAIHVTVGIFFWIYRQLIQTTEAKEVSNPYNDITFIPFSASIKSDLLYAHFAARRIVHQSLIR